MVRLPYPSDDIFTKRVEVELPVTEGVKVTIKQPTLEDEEKAIRTLASSPGITIEIIFETLLIESITEDFNGHTQVFTDRIEIIDAYKSLPARDKRKIFDPTLHFEVIVLMNLQRIVQRLKLFP